MKKRSYVHPAHRIAAGLFAIASLCSLIAHFRPQLRIAQAVITICAGIVSPFLIIYAAVRSRPSKVGEALISFFFTMVIVLMSYADIYQTTGLIIDSTTTPVPMPITTKQDAVYFSLVTWTTLGYGDMHPHGFCRILAGTEALVGNIFLGTFVTLLFIILTRTHDDRNA